MKRLSIIVILFILPVAFMASCEQPAGGNKALQARVDSLQSKLDSAYVPGTGEIMNGIVQPHHYKLWLAGQQQNWKLAEYERHQLSGGFKRIRKYHKNTPEAAALAMIYPEMDALEKAIKQKDAAAFKNHFALLTNTCNICHQATKYEFNVITVPSAPNFDNQRF
jgi:hypothetical protein